MSKNHKGKHRYINTKFWDDPYIVDLDPSEKLLFLYFITNPLTNIIGVYEVSLRRISFDTGFDKEMILKILDRFSKDNKITYQNGYVIIKNFVKNQRQSDNPEDNINKGIQNMLDSLPELTLKTLQDPFIPLNYSNSNCNINCNSNCNINCNSNLSNATKNNAGKPALKCKMKSKMKSMPTSIKFWCKMFSHACLKDDKYCMSLFNKIVHDKETEFIRKGLDHKSHAIHPAIVNGIKDQIQHPDSWLNAEIKKKFSEPIKWGTFEEGE